MSIVNKNDNLRDLYRSKIKCEFNHKYMLLNLNIGIKYAYI